MEKPKLKLVGEDGNVFSIMGRAYTAWNRTNGRGEESTIEWKRIQEDIMGGDYDHALCVVMDNFDCDSYEDDD